MYVKDGGDECICFCLENNMANLTKEKISFGPFQVFLDSTNAENIAKFKLSYVGGFNFVWSMTPNQSVLV